jgi:hypothetical protein
MDRLPDNWRHWTWLWTANGSGNAPKFRVNAHADILGQPLLAIQAALRHDEIPVGTSLAVFSQTFGGALFLSLAQTTFATTLEHVLPRLAPGVDPQTVINAGASDVRAVIPKNRIEGVLLAYNEGIRNVFYLAAGTAAAVFFVCWGMGWKSVKKAKTVSPEA